MRRFFHRVVKISTTRKAYLLVDLAARFVAVSKRVGQAAAAASSSPSSSAPPALCFVEELVELVTMREQDASLDNRADEMEAPDALVPSSAGGEQGDGEEEKEVQTFPYVRCVSLALVVSATFPFPISDQSSHIRLPQQHDGALLPRGSLPGRAAASRSRPAPPGALRQSRCRARAQGTNRGLRRLLGQNPVSGVLDLKRACRVCLKCQPNRYQTTQRLASPDGPRALRPRRHPARRQRPPLRGPEDGDYATSPMAHGDAQRLPLHALPVRGRPAPHRARGDGGHAAAVQRLAPRRGGAPVPDQGHALRRRRAAPGGLRAAGPEGGPALALR